MPEPLKNIYTQDFIQTLSKELKKGYKKFDSKGFEFSVFNEDWSELELKQRMRHIALNLKEFIPKSFHESINIMKPAATQFGGFESMFFPDYVELYGLDDFDISIDAMEHFTKYSSSEFAVRPFIKKYPDKMMRQMSLWAESDNYHVRRLASEGCRPRLPWAMALPKFKKNPQPVLKILEKLKHDNEEYVRRSVANNLNDISKDNPDLVIKKANKWLGHSAETDWVVKHACRSLLKAGHKDVLTLFGFSCVDHIELNKFKIDNAVAWNGELNFSFRLISKEKRLDKLRIEYAIYFVKSNKKQSKKVFKISEGNYPEAEKEIFRSFSFKPISTRKYYPGKHELSIIVNGEEFRGKSFVLLEK